MARIRSIKPEFWTSEQIVECSRDARLMFIGLWNFCDDHGIHPASPRRIKMEIFPADDIDSSNVQLLLDELSKNGLIDFYFVDSVEYLHITGWSKHQRIDRPSYKYPTPDKADPQRTPDLFDDQSSNDRDGVDRSGVEWSGEDIEQKTSMSGSVDETAQEQANPPAIDPPPNGKANAKQQAIEVLEFLNEKTGRRYQAVDANLKLISARLKEGATTAQCRQVIAKKFREWNTDPKMAEYLRPATLFNATKFAQYVGELIPPQETHPRQGDH